MIHRIHSRADWTNELAESIAYANDGDTIVVSSEHMKELAERARARMYPNKQLVFTVESETEL